jgi:hypothetical protein
MMFLSIRFAAGFFIEVLLTGFDAIDGHLVLE